MNKDIYITKVADEFPNNKLYKIIPALHKWERNSKINRKEVIFFRLYISHTHIYPLTPPKKGGPLPTNMFNMLSTTHSPTQSHKL